MRNSRTELFDSTRFRTRSRQSQLQLAITLLGDSGLINSIMLTHLDKSFHVKTASLATAIQPLIQYFPRQLKELFQASGVAYYSVVVVVSSQLCIQLPKELL